MEWGILRGSKFHSVGAAVSCGFGLKDVHYEEGAAGFREE